MTTPARSITYSTQRTQSSRVTLCPKGHIGRQQDWSLQVKLEAESRREWRYLRQHMAGSQLWQAVEECKKALAAEIAARLTLMDRIATIVRDAPERGGLGLPIEPNLGVISVMCANFAPSVPQWPPVRRRTATCLLDKRPPPK